MRSVCAVLLLLVALPATALADTHEQEPPDLNALFERA